MMKKVEGNYCAPAYKVVPRTTSRVMLMGGICRNPHCLDGTAGNGYGAQFPGAGRLRRDMVCLSLSCSGRAISDSALGSL